MPSQGDCVVTGPEDPGQVKIWDVVTGKELLRIKHPKGLSQPVAFSPDGTEVLAACHADKTLIAFDSRTGQQRHVYALPEEAKYAAYSPDGDCVALGAFYRSQPQVYNAKSGAFLAELESGERTGLREIQWLSDSQTLVAHFNEGPLLLYNIQGILRLR